MESKKEWRCPYCDAWNDWQDRVCQICGDGTRDAEEQTETEKQCNTTGTEAFQGKQYTDQKSKIQSSGKIEKAAVQEPAQESEKVEADITPAKKELYEPANADEKKKRWSMSPVGSILSVLAVAAMIYIDMTGYVAEDIPSQAAWFGLLAAICLINVAALLMKKPGAVIVCLILKYLTDAIGVAITISSTIYFYPDTRDFLLTHNGVFLALILFIPALNCWLAFKLGNRKH